MTSHGLTGRQERPPLNKDGALAVHGTGVLVKEREDARSPFTYLRRLRTVRGADAKVLEDLHTELSLLREENARLRVERERTPDVGQVIERMRNLPATSFSGEEGDEAWHLLTEGFVMRDALIDVCDEIQQAMVTLKSRLHSIVPALQANALDHNTSDASANGVKSAWDRRAVSEISGFDRNKVNGRAYRSANTWAGRDRREALGG